MCDKLVNKVFKAHKIGNQLISPISVKIEATTTRTQDGI